MPKRREKYIQIERSRHGRVVYYFRRDRQRVRLPDEYGSPEFWRAYYQALSGDVQLKPPSPQAENPSRMAVSIAVRKSLNKARVRAKAKGREFDIDEDWVLDQIERQRFNCALTGIPFYMAHEAVSYRNPYAPSIDRIDARGGYTKSNVRVVIFAMNVMLFDWGQAVFERVVSGYQSAKRSLPRSSAHQGG